MVPIHNAAQAFSRCLRSLLRYTPPEIKLVLIDDASTDPEIERLLASARTKQNTVVLVNASNEGYTRTINQGICFAPDHDIILLNSDTEVGPGWARQLAATAYQATDIGTVTAISNNAGAFAYPEVEQDNPLPGGYSNAQVSLLLRQAEGAVYPELPTGNGFCMFIKRGVFEAVGLFDADAFPRGYGEENDFCMRALRLGWRHVQDDRTWVFHVRSASLAPEVPALGEAGMAVLDKRYGDYRQLVEAGMTSNRRSLAEKRVRRLFDSVEAKLVADPKPRILAVGATAEALEFLASLAPFECYSLAVAQSTLSLCRVTGGEVVVQDEHELLDPVVSVNPVSAEYDAVLREWLWRYAIDLIDLHAPDNHSVGLATLAEQSAIPLVVRLTDYYGLCPTGNLIDDADTFCAGQCTPDTGQDCSVSRWRGPKPRLKGKFVTRWRKNLRRLYRGAGAFVTAAPEISRRLLALGMISPSQKVHHVDLEAKDEMTNLLGSLVYPVRQDIG